MNSIWLVALLTAVKEAAMELIDAIFIRTEAVDEVMTNFLLSSSVTAVIN